MNQNRPESDQRPVAKKMPGVYSRPVFLFLLSAGIIFAAEFLIMLFLRTLPTFSPFREALVDSLLLSSLILPALFMFVYRPLEANIGTRLKVETEHKQMQKLDQVKNQFISTAAHELSTPLCVVIGYTELLLSSKKLTQEDRQQYLQAILDKALVLDRLTHDLLDLSRIDSGQVVRFNKAEQSLLPIIESVVHFFQYSHPARAFETVLPAEIPSLQIDAVRIGQLLENLIGNSIKYSPDSEPVRLEVEEHAQDVRIIISDHGVGMTREQTMRTFEKFYRVDRSDAAVGGLGLGMTIVKEIVEGHSGSIRVDSVFGEGTSVTVMLPKS